MLLCRKFKYIKEKCNIIGNFLNTFNNCNSTQNLKSIPEDKKCQIIITNTTKKKKRPVIKIQKRSRWEYTIQDGDAVRGKMWAQYIKKMTQT